MTTTPKTNEESQELVKAGSAVAVPSYLESLDLSGPTGLEAITAKDMKMPRLAVAQNTHKQQDEESPEYIQGLKKGMFFDTVHKTVFGKGPLLITPLIAKKHRRLFTPRDQGSKTLCVSENGLNGGRINPASCDRCPKSKFGFNESTNSSTKPECTLFWTYLILVHESEDKFYPISMSLKSKMIPAAEEFNAFMHARRIGGRRAPAFAGVYTVESFYDTSSAGGAFFNVKFKNAEWVPEKLLANVQAMFNEFSSKIHDVANYNSANDVDAIDAEVVDGDVPF